MDAVWVLPMTGTYTRGGRLQGPWSPFSVAAPPDMHGCAEKPASAFCFPCPPPWVSGMEWRRWQEFLEAWITAVMKGPQNKKNKTKQWWSLNFVLSALLTNLWISASNALSGFSVLLWTLTDRLMILKFHLQSRSLLWTFGLMYSATSLTLQMNLRVSSQLPT